ncbi:MAG: M20 family metallo-hydrolase [Bacteroidota bacterium]
MNNKTKILSVEAIDLLKQLIQIPSFSKEEWETASVLTKLLFDKNILVTRAGNNVIARNKFFDEHKPTILLNSHHDTVKPNPGYTRNPFEAVVEDGKLFGLGSNDAGGCLVSLMATFLYFFDEEHLKYNLVFAATAEEEISGSNGIEMALQHLPKIDSAIVGEPTEMQMAVAERGLIVLDCVAKGKAGHAARNEGDNALYNALADIEWIRNFRFEKTSELLGEVKMCVTSIETENKAHNVVPDSCRFVVDVRVNEMYSLEEVVSTIQANLKCNVQPRSLRMKSSGIAMDHPLVKSGLSLGRKVYGSPTTSDKALMPFPALKMGPGNSARSHTADEFIYVDEIESGIVLYIKLLEQLLR